MKNRWITACATLIAAVAFGGTAAQAGSIPVTDATQESPRKIYVLPKHNDIGELLSDQATLAYITNAVDDYGMATNREDPVLVRLLQTTLAQSQLSAVPREDAVAERPVERPNENSR